MGFTRMGSISISDEPLLPPPSSDLDRFLDQIRVYAGTFHRLIHGVNQDRFLGNASFRCTKGGFPAFRENDQIWVSRRNIDKREITPEGFIGVEFDGDRVRYHGRVKPSVDTPIQRELFKLFPEVKWMLHSHTYIDGAPYTPTLVPCGCLEEIDHVKRMLPAGYGRVNLTGHGCLILARTVDEIADIPFISRPFPEVH